jgi:ribosomal protein S18 acetylase RimI-like enzyme
MEGVSQVILIRDGIFVIEDPSLAGEMSDLHTAAFGFQRSLSLTAYQIKERIKDPLYEVFGYVLNGSLIGFFFLYSASIFDVKLLESLCVAPWQKGRGIGSQMLRFILDKYGFHDFHLTVTYENDAARGLYRKFGFNEADGLNMKREGK